MRMMILGSGMAGLGAAYRLRQQGVESVVLEKNGHYGGHTASHQYPGGFTFDEGPHVSFTKDERIQDLFAANVDGQYQTLNTYVNNHWRGHWIKHPAQCNLHGLPEDLVVKILQDFIEARYGPAREVETYEDWLKASFGDTFATTFPMEYCLKYHTTTADNMTTDWLGSRLYQADLEELLRGALSPQTPDVHYISHFRYPTRGGFAAYLKPFAAETDIRLGHEVVRIDPADRRLYCRDGRELPYDRLISSVPLPELVPMIDGTPPDVMEAAQRLACSEVVLVNVGVAREDILEAHWTYFYDQDYIFTRLSTPHLQSPNNVPDGCGSIQVECYYSRKYRPLDRPPEACIEPVLADLRRCGLLREDDEILLADAKHVPYANVIFDLDRPEALATVHGYLDDLGIAYCGRYGDWGYMWTDQSFKSGERAAQQALDAPAPRRSRTVAG